jgi:hypothetical protein
MAVAVIAGVVAAHQWWKLQRIGYLARRADRYDTALWRLLRGKR